MVWESEAMKRPTEQRSKTMTNTNTARKLFTLDEVADLIPAVDAVYDDDGNVIDDREPEYWADKVTGVAITPDVILPCIHAWEGDAENVRRGLAACWALGVSAREALALWGRCDWRQVSCVVVQ